MNTEEYILTKYEVPEDAKFPLKLNIKRRNLSALFKELGFKVGVEIGVDMGHYSEELCLMVPGLKLYSVDPWLDEYESHEELARERLKPYGNCEIIKKTSMEAVKDFKPGSIDFVYIDADHSFDCVLEDLTEWSKIVREGGLVSGHDYFYVKFPHRRKSVRVAVDKYLKEHNVEKFFMLNRNNQSSWFFVKK